MPRSRRSASARDTFSPSGPAPTTTALRRERGRFAWWFTMWAPAHTASHCSTGVARAHSSKARVSNRPKLLVA